MLKVCARWYADLSMSHIFERQRIKSKKKREKINDDPLANDPRLMLCFTADGHNGDDGGDCNDINLFLPHFFLRSFFCLPLYDFYSPFSYLQPVSRKYIQTHRGIWQTRAVAVIYATLWPRIFSSKSWTSGRWCSTAAIVPIATTMQRDLLVALHHRGCITCTRTWTTEITCGSLKTTLPFTFL